jgi:hypothetical protein
MATFRPASGRPVGVFRLPVVGAPPAFAGMFVVNSTVDAVDIVPGDGSAGGAP